MYGPEKPTDVCLESILWNKVPVELQREAKEITTDGSVHELLQKLLRAETVIQEHAQQEKTKDNESKSGNSSSPGSSHGGMPIQPQSSYVSLMRTGIPHKEQNQK